MISDAMATAINGQIKEEIYSSYIYLAMAAHFEAENLPGFANWMQLQAQEELVHAMKMFAHLSERGTRVELQALDAPPSTWESPLAAFEAAYEHEVYISGTINALVSQAVKENDHATIAFLQWFVTEQVEEEASADAVVQKLKLVGKTAHGLFMIDRELAGRAPSAPK